MRRRSIIIILCLLFFSSCEKDKLTPVETVKFYGDAYEDIGYSIAEAEGGYYITGKVTEITRDDNNYIDNANSIAKMGIIKTDSDGNTLHAENVVDNMVATGLKILVLEDGSAVSVGYAVDTITKKDILVVKTNSDGSVVTEKIYKSSGNQYGRDIIKTDEGYLILATTDLERLPLTDSTGNASGRKDILLLRIDDSLEPITTSKAFGFPGDDEGMALKEDINGGYIIVGTTDRSEPDQDLNNILLLRINLDGSVTQPRILGDDSDEYAADIEVVNNGYLIAGNIGSEGGEQKGRVWIIPDNIYAAPTQSEDVDLNIEESITINAISRYKHSSVVMAGQIGQGSSARMLVFVADLSGNADVGKVKIAGSTGTQVAYDVISDDEDNIIAVGKNSYDNNSMISLLKFRF